MNKKILAIIGLILILFLSGCVSIAEKSKINLFYETVLKEEVGLEEPQSKIKTMMINEAGGLEQTITMSDEDRKKLEKEYFTYFKTDKPELVSRIYGFSSNEEAYKDLIDTLNIDYTELFSDSGLDGNMKKANHIPNISKFDNRPLFKIPNKLEPEIYLSVYPNSEESYKVIIKDYPTLIKSSGKYRAEWLIENKQLFIFNISIEVKNNSEELNKLKGSNLKDVIKSWIKIDIEDNLNNFKIDTYIESIQKHVDLFDDNGKFIYPEMSNE